MWLCACIVITLGAESSVKEENDCSHFSAKMTVVISVPFSILSPFLCCMSV